MLLCSQEEWSKELHELKFYSGLKKLGKDEITADDIKDAENERNERLKAAEEARLEAERKAAEGGEEQAPAEDEWF